MSEQLPISESDFDLMVEIGFLALDAGLHDEQEQLMQSLAALRNDKPYPAIGLALNRYVRGDRQDAITRLRDVLTRFPDAVYTRSLLASFLKEAGQTGWEDYARQVLERINEGVAADMARDLLDETKPAASSAPHTSVLNEMRGRRA